MESERKTISILVFVSLAAALTFSRRLVSIAFAWELYQSFHSGQLYNVEHSMFTYFIMMVCPCVREDEESRFPGFKLIHEHFFLESG